jgi:hypothetical protein
VRKVHPLRVMGIGAISCLVLFSLWLSKAIRDDRPREINRQQHIRRLATGETLRMETWERGERFHTPFCRMDLYQEVLGPFLRRKGFCDFEEPAELFRFGERRVLSTGAVLFSKLDSEPSWSIWSAFDTDAPAFLDQGLASGPQALRVQRVSVGYRGSQPHVEVQVKAAGEPVLFFDSDEFDLAATMERNPNLGAIPFPEDRALESYGPERAVRQIGPRWTDASIGGEAVRIRGAYGNRDRKRCTIYVRRPGLKYLALQLAMGEWNGGFNASVRVQPRLPAGARSLPSPEIVDPVAAKEFASVPTIPHSARTLISLDGRVMALLTPDGWKATAIFDAVSGKFMSSLRDTAGGFRSAGTVRLSPDGAYIAALTPQVTVWETRSGEKLTTLSGSYNALAFAGKGELVLGRDGALEIRDATDLRKLRAVLPCTPGYLSIDVSADGSRLAAGSWKGEVETWILPAATKSRTLRVFSERRNVGVMLSPDGRWLMASTEGHRNAIWNVDTGAQTAAVPGYPMWFATHADPLEVVMACWDRLCTYGSDGGLVRQITQPEGGSPIDPGGRFLTFQDGRIMKVNPDDGKVEYVLTLIGLGSPAPASPRDAASAPSCEWIAVHPGSLFYSSSEYGDEYAYLRFGPHLAPLREYRARYRK